VREDVQSRRLQQQGLARQIAALEARVDATPRTEAELSTLTRDHQKLKEQYLALLDKKMAARIKKSAEDAKVACRNIRRDGNKHFDQSEKAKEMTEDDRDKGKEEVQSMLKKYEEKIAEMAEKKDTEIMEQ